MANLRSISCSHFHMAWARPRNIFVYAEEKIQEGFVEHSAPSTGPPVLKVPPQQSLWEDFPGLGLVTL